METQLRHEQNPVLWIKFPAGILFPGIRGGIWRLLRLHKHCQERFRESRRRTRSASLQFFHGRSIQTSWKSRRGNASCGLATVVFLYLVFQIKIGLNSGMLIVYLILPDFTGVHPWIYIFHFGVFSSPPLVPQDTFDVSRGVVVHKTQVEKRGTR